MSFKNCKIVGIGINPEKYHAQEAGRGTPDYIVSPSSLKTFLECPSRWKAGYEPPDSDAKQWGSLLDCLTLTPESFKERFSVKPATYPADGKKGEQPVEKPWNGNSTWCKEWMAKQSGKEVISKTELDSARLAMQRMNSDETISAFLAASDKQVHVKGEWQDEKTGVVFPVQCLIDCAPKPDSEFQKCLGDLKTTRNAAQRPFARWCFTAGYHIQAAFDLAIYQGATGQDRTDWVFLLSENYAPYETGRRLLSQDLLEIGQKTFQYGLSQYAESLKSGIWRGYDAPDEFSIVAAEPWQEFAALEDNLEREQFELTQPTAASDDITP